MLYDQDAEAKARMDRAKRDITDWLVNEYDVHLAGRSKDFDNLLARLAARGLIEGLRVFKESMVEACDEGIDDFELELSKLQ